ncbi:hypothetical protein [Foetidibacter luteolus]|uniref:hypothetical protein n=1 Tax=Foetidibacter luteolus TaxID=2608880 RepID=UPI00129B0BFF|nr:hypothetical protein [Foetidibacter luteolus]
MKLYFFLFAMFSTGTLCLGNDSIVVKAKIFIDFKSEFYVCHRNDFRQFIDPISSNTDKMGITFSIAISDTQIIFRRGSRKVRYKRIDKDSSDFRFESYDRKMARAISVCNREMFPYRLKIDLNTGSISLFYENEFRREQIVVFQGKLIEYSKRWK